MPHEKTKQSTGGWKSNRDQHEGRQKQNKEKKKQSESWVRKGDTKKKKKGFAEDFFDFQF